MNETLFQAAGSRKNAGFAVARVGSVAGAVAGLLLVWQAPAAAPPRLGVWRLTGSAEFQYKHLPPHGPAKHSYSSGFQTVYEIADGKVRFTSTYPKNPKVRVVGEIQWGRPPAVIVPGEVIPVNGSAVLLEYQNGGTGFGQAVSLQAQFGGQLILGMEKGVPIQAASHPSGGRPARRSVEYRNTTEFWGKKGTPYSDSKREVHLVFIASGAPDAPHVAYRYVWSPGGEIKPGR